MLINAFPALNRTLFDNNWMEICLTKKTSFLFTCGTGEHTARSIGHNHRESSPADSSAIHPQLSPLFWLD